MPAGQLRAARRGEQYLGMVRTLRQLGQATVSPAVTDPQLRAVLTAETRDGVPDSLRGTVFGHERSTKDGSGPLADTGCDGLGTEVLGP